MFTSSEVTIALWPCKTVVHSVLFKFQMRIALSQLLEATNVFSKFMSISLISFSWPLSVANSLHPDAHHTLIKLSSAPLTKLEKYV